jgi:hypothetical protein
MGRRKVSSSRLRRVAIAGLFISILVMVTLLMSEVAARIFLGEEPAIAEPPESMFWEYDERLGWSRIPNSVGDFSNGLYSGHVTNDADGNRLNAPGGTFIAGYRNIFFLGDSTTASLEVDNEETIPALLESTLRAHGKRVNVINLGVRGYGTDQAVLKAREFASKYGPADIFYLFTDNDLFNNNVLKQGGRKFGKGVFIRRAGETGFTAHNYPVPEYGEDEVGLVVLDDDCRPFGHEGEFRRPPPPQVARENAGAGSRRRGNWLARHSCLYRSVRKAWKEIGRRRDAEEERRRLASVDPYRLIREESRVWDPLFVHAFKDYGEVRRRCAEYYDSQMRHFMNMLREIDSVEHVYLAEFPAGSILELLSRGETSVNRRLFQGLVTTGHIDRYVDLPQRVIDDAIDTTDLMCPGDPHFCADGNRWIADVLAEEVPW